MRQLDLFGNIIETNPEGQKLFGKEDDFTTEEDELAANETALPDVDVKRDISDIQELDADPGQEINNFKQEQISVTSPMQISIIERDEALSAEETVEVFNTYSMDHQVEGAGQTAGEVEFFQSSNETESVQTSEETETEQTYQKTGTEETFEAAVNNPQDTLAEDLPIQIIALSGVKEVIVEEPVETSENITEEKPSDKINASEIFNDGKIRVKIKQKLPAVAVAEEEIKEEIKEQQQEDQPEEQPTLTSKRGRKSFKEIDAEVDLIEIPEDEVLFERQYYSISQVAEWFKVNTSLIRFWENEFDILKPKKNRKGDRLFRPEDVKNLQLIYHLLRQRKYTIEGAKEYIKTNKTKADLQLQLINTLQKVRSFLLDLKANL